MSTIRLQYQCGGGTMHFYHVTLWPRLSSRWSSDVFLQLAHFINIANKLNLR